LAGKAPFRVRAIARLWDGVVAAADSACGDRGGGWMTGWPAAQPRSSRSSYSQCATILLAEFLVPGLGVLRVFFRKL